MFERYAYDATEFVISKCRENLTNILFKTEDINSCQKEIDIEKRLRDNILNLLKQKGIDIEYMDFSLEYRCSGICDIKPRNLYTAVCLFGQNPRYNKEEFEGKYKYKCKIGTFTFTEGEECSTRIFVNFPRPSENIIFKLMNQAFIF